MGREGSPMTAAGGQPPNNGDTPPSGQRKRGCGATQPAADRACSTIRTSKSHAEWVRQFAKDNRLHQQVVVDHAVELLKKEGSGVMRSLPATDVLVHVVRPGMSRGWRAEAHSRETVWLHRSEQARSAERLYGWRRDAVPAARA
eukprot:jgi/Tetstr1/422863/TSEL_013654.t1